MTPTRILLIYTGGTIGMRENPTTGALENVDWDRLSTSALLSNLTHREAIEIDTIRFAPPVDSCDIGPRQWRQLTEIIATHYDAYFGFVILHGTDTMAYTASALSFMLEGLAKPVVLTGSQLPIGRLRSDADVNLVTAIEVAAAKDEQGEPRLCEVCIMFHDKVLRGNRTTKSNADAFDAFCSFNYPPLASAAIDLEYNEVRDVSHTSNSLTPHYEMDTNVLVVSLFPGIQEQTLRSMFETPYLKGVVMRTFGSGNAPSSPWLSALLAEYVGRGIVVVNITQCAGGNVVMQRYETGLNLQHAGVVSGGDSTVEAALTKMMRLFGDGLSGTEVAQQMSHSLAGEL